MNDAPGRKPPVDPNIFEWGSVHTSIWRTADISKAGCFGNTTFFKTPPNDCPRALAEKFLALMKNDPNAETYDSWKARVGAQEQHAQAKLERLNVLQNGLGAFII